MKLTKGKIFKLINKKKQTKKTYKSKNKIIKNKKTFRTKRKINLSNTSLKNSIFKSSKDDNERKEKDHSETEELVVDNKEIQDPIEVLENKDGTIDNDEKTKETEERGEFKEINGFSETKEEPEIKEHDNMHPELQDFEETTDSQDIQDIEEISDNKDIEKDNENDEPKLIDETPIEIEFEDLDIENNSENNIEKEPSVESNDLEITQPNTTIETKIEYDSPSEKLFQNEDSENVLPPKKSKKRFRLTKKSRMDKIV
jgi:hypothetical protein